MNQPYGFDPGRYEDIVVLQALSLYDRGCSFDEIGLKLQRDAVWAREVCLAVFLSESAEALLQ